MTITRLMRIFLFNAPCLALLMVAPAMASLHDDSEVCNEYGENEITTVESCKNGENGESALQLLAQESSADEIPVEDDGFLRITVTGTRTPREVDDLPATVTVFELEDIEFYQNQNLRDLLRYEPGVSVRNDLRFGLQDVNIRGIEGNRVLFQLDNIRLPERFEFGPFNIGRGEYVDLATLQAVEILRGPASTLYGSDALGGVVSFRGLEAEDLLEPGDDFAVELDSTYTSSSGGFDNFVRIATRNEEIESALVYSRRDSREVDNFASADLVNPQDREGNTFYGNIQYLLNDTSSLSFVAEDFNRDVRTTTQPQNLSSFGSTIQQTFVEDISFDRTRFSLAYEYDDPDSPSFIQYARAQIFSQEATEVERNLENRITGGVPLFRDTENKFIADSYGGDIQLQSDFTTGNVDHRLTYGIDISTTFNSRPRDRSQTDLTTGITTNVIPPDTFPVKDFPDGDTLRLGVYLQDELEVGPFDLIAGLRFDHYDLDTSPDADFARNGAESANLNESALSPRIALQYEATPELSFYGQYARGFRAPLYSEINSGFTNTTGRFFKYRTISNPDLEPETSNSFELGVRGNYENFDFGLTGFYNTYDNFISTFEAAGTECLIPADPCPQGGPNGTAVVNIFQTQNISEAEIYGVEFGGQYRMGDFSLLGSLAWVEGNDTSGDNNVPLTTVDPFEAVLGLRYLAPSDKWQAELIGTIVGEPRLADDATTFDPSPYFTVDLIGAYQFTPRFSMNLGVYNIFDEKYFIYSDVRNRPEDDPSIDRYSQPGTNVRVGVNLTF